MIHFFSGLFGGKETWSSYQQLGVNRIYDITELPEKIDSEDILIGYSLGGRIALKLASEMNFNIKKLILLSAHPGLDEAEKPTRQIWEDNILKQMDTLGTERFLKYWDTLNIFTQSQVKKELSDATFKIHRDSFDLHRLSLQKNYLPEMILNKYKVTYIYGKHDEKYSQLGHKLKSHAIRCIEIDTDHRVYLKPNLLIPILQRELIS
jgi:2-succinyl-6-hydroxy-2,4-cyclohexadiene-1-carboxylate synthase